MNPEPRVNEFLQGYHGDRRVVQLPQNDSERSGFAWQEKVPFPPDWEEADRQRVQDLFAQRVRVLQSRPFAHVAPLHKVAVEQDCLVVVEGHLDAKRDFNSDGTPRTLLDYLDEKRGLDPQKLVPVVRQLLLAYLELYEAGLPYYGAIEPQDVACLGDWSESYPRIVLTGASLRFLSYEGIPRPGEKETTKRIRREKKQNRDLAHLGILICKAGLGLNAGETLYDSNDSKIKKTISSIAPKSLREVIHLLMLSDGTPEERLRNGLYKLEQEDSSMTWQALKALAGVLILFVVFATGLFAGRETEKKPTGSDSVHPNLPKGIIPPDVLEPPSDVPEGDPSKKENGKSRDNQQGASRRSSLQFRFLSVIPRKYRVVHDILRPAIALAIISPNCLLVFVQSEEEENNKDNDNNEQVIVSKKELIKLIDNNRKYKSKLKELKATIETYKTLLKKTNVELAKKLKEYAELIGAIDAVFDKPKDRIQRIKDAGKAEKKWKQVKEKLGVDDDDQAIEEISKLIEIAGRFPSSAAAAKEFAKLARRQMGLNRFQVAIHALPQNIAQQIRASLAAFLPKRKYTMTIHLPTISLEAAKKSGKEKGDLYKDFIVYVKVNGNNVLERECHLWDQSFPRTVTFDWQADWPIQIVVEGDRTGPRNDTLIDVTFQGAVALWLVNDWKVLQSSDGIYALQVGVPGCPGPSPPKRPNRLPKQKAKNLWILKPKIPQNSGYTEFYLNVTCDKKTVWETRWPAGKLPRFPKKIKLVQPFSPDEITVNLQGKGAVLGVPTWSDLIEKTFSTDGEATALEKIERNGKVQNGGFRLIINYTN